MAGIDEPGKTPRRSVANNGISSAINFGTTVSHTDLNRIFCSNSSSCLLSNLDVSILLLLAMPISSLFILPAETSTLFKALRPKS